MNEDDWQLLFAGTEWDNLSDLSEWFCDAYEDFPKWESEIKQLIEQAYKMGYHAGYKAAQIERKKPKDLGSVPDMLEEHDKKMARKGPKPDSPNEWKDYKEKVNRKAPHLAQDEAKRGEEGNDTPKDIKAIEMAILNQMLYGIKEPPLQNVTVEMAKEYDEAVKIENERWRKNDN